MPPKPAPNDYLQRWPVSKRVNSSKADADDATLIERIDCATAHRRPSCPCLIRVGKQITLSNADPSDHLIEDIAAGPFSAVPQTILDALPKYVLRVQICVHFATGQQMNTY